MWQRNAIRHYVKSLGLQSSLLKTIYPSYYNARFSLARCNQTRKVYKVDFSSFFHVHSGVLQDSYESFLMSLAVLLKLLT